MLTAKGKYGLKALAYLSTLAPGEKAQAVEIAKAGNIPKKFLDAILGDLRRAGFVRSKTGREGGYMLTRPAAKIRVGQVIRALDGPLAPIGCASLTGYQHCDDCPNEKNAPSG